MADVIAQRADTSWISITGGRSNIVCVVASPTGVHPPAAMLHEISQCRDVAAVEADVVVHEFLGGRRGLIDKQRPLSDAQVAMLHPPRAPDRPIDQPPVHDADAHLLTELADDGRIGIATLAATICWSPSTVRRRLDHLRRTGQLYFTAETTTTCSTSTRVILRLHVPGDQLSAVGTALAADLHTAYVAATTGVSNLYCAAWCPTVDAIDAHLNERLALLGPIDACETVPVIHTVKTHGLRNPPGV